MDPELRQRFLYEIITYLVQNGHAEDFEQSQAIFDRAFRHAAEFHGRPYGEQHQAAGQSLYFTPFSETSPFWRYSIEIFDLHDHYAIFDRTGRYAIYEKNGVEFGRLVFASPSSNSIALLEGCGAGDMISSIVGFRQNYLSILRIINNRLKLDAVHKQHISGLLSKMLGIFRQKSR